MVIMRWLVAVCGRVLHLIRGPMPSSGAGPAALITGRIGLLNLLPVVLPVERVRVPVVARLGTVLPGHTQQAAHISLYA